MFFFKQKTAYEMRISDWSSDVCSSDLLAVSGDGDDHAGVEFGDGAVLEPGQRPARGGLVCELIGGKQPLDSRDLLVQLNGYGGRRLLAGGPAGSELHQSS